MIRAGLSPAKGSWYKCVEIHREQSNQGSKKLSNSVVKQHYKHAELTACLSLLVSVLVERNRSLNCSLQSFPAQSIFLLIWWFTFMKFFRSIV